MSANISRHTKRLTMRHTKQDKLSDTHTLKRVDTLDHGKDRHMDGGRPQILLLLMMQITSHLLESDAESSKAFFGCINLACNLHAVSNRTIAQAIQVIAEI